MTPEELKAINDGIMENVEAKIKTITETAKPKDDMFTVKQFNEHQSTCHDLDCPACSSMNQKLVGEKISKVDKLVNDISTKLRGNIAKEN